MNWLENDLKVLELEHKIRILTQEFNSRNPESEDYYKKLELFLQRKLKKATKDIVAEQFLIVNTSLKENI